MSRKEDLDKFKKLAEGRVSSALKAIQLIGNLSNRSNYDYSEEDVAKIFKALQDELSACKKRFELAAKKQASALFTLD